MAILQFRTSTYARNIICYGAERLTARDGYNGVAEGYYIPVEQFIANGSITTPLMYGVSKIQEALTNGWINQQEYDEIISYIPTTETTV